MKTGNLKTYKGFKTRTKPLRAKGRSNRSKTRAAWQKEMVETYAHITYCEYPGCHSTFGLAHAHSLKKTKITTREQWMDVVKLCQQHHDFVEYGDRTVVGTHERMFNLVHQIRNLSPQRASSWRQDRRGGDNEGE